MSLRAFGLVICLHSHWFFTDNSHSDHVAGYGRHGPITDQQASVIYGISCRDKG